MVLKYLVYESLRNELTLKQLQLMVKQKYEHYRIVLMYFVQHFHHHVKLKLSGGPTTGTAAGTPVTILHAQNPT
jgi:hypothetical protein